MKTVGTVFDDVVQLVKNHVVACTEEAAYTWNGVSVRQMTAGILGQIHIKLVDGSDVIRHRNAKWED